MKGYIFNVADSTPQYHRVELVKSGKRPGYYLCIRDGVTMVVTPDGVVRDITADEVAHDNTDSAWTQAALFGDMLVYDTAPDGQPYHVVAFKVLG